MKNQAIPGDIYSFAFSNNNVTVKLYKELKPISGRIINVKEGKFK